MSELSGMLVVLAIWVVPFTVFYGAILLARRIYHRRDRKNPLTRDLLRQPGHSLREQRDDQLSELLAVLAVGSALPLMLYALYQARVTATPTTTGPSLGLYITAGLVAMALVAWRIFRTVRRVRDLGLGLEAETAVGQELNWLMRDGFAVFHDIPGGKDFNIDHVVVGPSGVYAVETKGRSKAVRKDGQGHRVEFSGDRLVFPGWTETEPLAQARRNAEWLRKWLSSAVGEALDAKPVLIIPGWYVDRKNPCDVAILNETNAKPYFRGQRGGRLSEKLVQQIIHQLDARCRDVPAKTYKPVTEQASARSA